MEARMRPVGLGSALFAIVLTTCVGAVAAELPTLRAAPQKHAKSCRVGGMEGYYINGSTVCVRVSGYVSAGVEMGKGSSSK
jgi:hypothetical protein